MVWWARARRVGVVAAVAAAATAVLAAVGGVEVPVPVLALGGTSTGVPLAVFSPVAVTSALAWSLAGGQPDLERAGLRPVAALDAALALALVVVAGGAAAATDVAGLAPLGAVAARNTAGYAGVALLARSAVGAAGPGPATVPAAYALLASTLGPGADHRTAWWAWPVADEGAPESWALATTFLAAGLAVTATAHRPGRRLASPSG